MSRVIDKHPIWRVSWRHAFCAVDVSGDDVNRSAGVSVKHRLGGIMGSPPTQLGWFRYYSIPTAFSWRHQRECISDLISTPFSTITVVTRSYPQKEERRRAIRYRPPSYQLHLMKFLCVITNKHSLSHDDCSPTHQRNHIHRCRAICHERISMRHVEANDGGDRAVEALSFPQNVI